MRCAGLRSPGAQEVQMMDGAALQSLKPDKVNGFEPAFAGDFAVQLSFSAQFMLAGSGSRFQIRQFMLCW